MHHYFYVSQTVCTSSYESVDHYDLFSIDLPPIDLLPQVDIVIIIIIIIVTNTAQMNVCFHRFQTLAVLVKFTLVNITIDSVKEILVPTTSLLRPCQFNQSFHALTPQCA